MVDWFIFKDMKKKTEILLYHSPTVTGISFKIKEFHFLGLLIFQVKFNSHGN